MKISEVSKQLDISEDTLRYYEKIDLVSPKRNSSHIRDYSEEDFLRLDFIKCMRQAGLSIEFLSLYLKMYAQGDSTLTERKNLLIQQREILLNKMNDMKKTLERLNFKIDNYDRLLSGKISNSHECEKKGK